ncbi:MAG TPA: PEGA domain-containing protein [Vicinamibacterales bacterium]
MALILALNPGNSHSPTLSRLARELHGCELIGAESCVVAISAIKKRVPDIVLLPAREARGEADLIAHLESIPGGVLTLKLPPVESANPVDLARQIREMLTGVSASADTGVPGFGTATPDPGMPVGTSPHLLAAATAAITWIRGRRAQWVERPSEVSHEPLPQWTGVSRSESDKPYEPIEPVELDESDAHHDSYATPDLQGRVPRSTQRQTWLPRAAGLASVIGVAAAMVYYWPQIRGGFGSAPDQTHTPGGVSPAADAIPTPVAPQPAAKPETDPLANVSGWVAVFAPFEIRISEGNQEVQGDERGRAMLAPGKHRLRLQNRELGYDETRTVEVRPAETTTINLTPTTRIAVTSNEPAEVLIDGTRVGDTPYDGTVNLGTHAVTVRSAGAERQLTVAATSKPVQLEIDFSKP